MSRSFPPRARRTPYPCRRARAHSSCYLTWWERRASAPSRAAPFRSRSSRRTTGGTSTSAARPSTPTRPPSSASSTTAARAGCIPTSAARSSRAASGSTGCPTWSWTARNPGSPWTSCSIPRRATAWLCRSIPCPSRPSRNRTGSREAIPATWISGATGPASPIVDRDNKYLYELYNVYYNAVTGRWEAGSGAFVGHEHE